MNCSTSKDGCKCSTCKDGFYLKNSQCLQCNSLCETCSQQDLMYKMHSQLLQKRE